MAGMSKSILPVLSPLALVLASCGTPAAGDSQPIAEPIEGATAFAIEERGTYQEPWALAIEPGSGRIVVTEKRGKASLFQPASDAGAEISGLPRVDHGGQGGLGDFIFAPDYAATGAVYLSWAEAGANDTRGAAVGRARLVCDDTDEGTCALRDLKVIWRQEPKVTGRGHFSHRLAFSPDGKYLFVASGDRQKMAPAQDFSVNLGKVLRLTPDGAPAPGNPFADKSGVSAQIWSYGHRNVLGLAFDAKGQLWNLEHGPAGGDELNLVKPGANYGWPLVSDGDHYDGRKIPRHATRPDLAAPAISWNPVIAPGGMVIYAGDEFPEWKGQVIIAGMRSGGLVRVAIDGGKAREVARYDFGKRIRAVAEGIDGALWIAEDGKDGKLYRLSRKPG